MFMTWIRIRIHIKIKCNPSTACYIMQIFWGIKFLSLPFLQNQLKITGINGLNLGKGIKLGCLSKKWINCNSKCAKPSQIHIKNQF